MNSGNYIKKIIVILAAGALLMAASSCGVPQESFEVKPTNVSTVIEMAKEITSGISYTITEPISFNKQVTEDGEEGLRRLEFLSIYGLNDTEVQNSINAALQANASLLYSDAAPAFNGIEEMPQLAEGHSLNVISKNTWNSNDIVSVLTQKTLSDEANSIEYLDCITMSLADGRELKLADLFASDFDYLSVINEAVDEALEEKWTLFDFNGELRQISAEKLSEEALVDEDTKFFLDDRGVNIILHSDDTDILFSEPREQSICVGFERFGRNWVIAGGCNEELYADPSSMGYAMTYSGAENYIVDETIRDLDREDVWMLDAMYYPEDMPEELIECARAMLEEATISDEEAQSFAKSGAVIWASLNNEITCRKIGDYYVMRRETTDNIRNAGNWASETVCRVYDSDFNEVQLGDIFASAWDYTDVFKQKLTDSWSLSYGAAGFVLDSGESTELSSDTLEELVESGSFELGSMGITLYTRTLEITNADASNTYLTPMSVFVPYGEFSLNHFALFGKI